MLDTPEPSELKRALLEKYLQGHRLQTTPAIGDIDRRTKAEGAGAREGVVAIQTGISRRPFFFLHGDWISGAYWCFPLARALGSDQPFYALEPYSFDNHPTPPPFETIAAAHLQSMRTVQPEVPYLLGGFCNGALLAYEMARQLHMEGETVELLVLIDPMPIGPFYPVHHRLTRALATRLGKLFRLSEEKQMYAYILSRHIYNYLRFSHYRRSKDFGPRRVDERLEFESRRKKGGFALPRLGALFPPVQILRQNYPAIYDWSAMLYVPPDAYPDRITFFWDSEEPWRRKGWRKAVKGKDIEVHIIPGTQMESRTTYLHVLAEHLKECLNRVQATAK